MVMPGLTFVSVALVTRKLDNKILQIVYRAASMGTEPRSSMAVLGLSEGDIQVVDSLFTEADGTRMHPDTLEALRILILSRM